jgi:hypothetical protein
MTDREKAGLRDPIRTRVEETMHSGGVVSIASEYSIEERLLTSRNAHPDGSQRVTTHAYDADELVTNAPDKRHSVLCRFQKPPVNVDCKSSRIRGRSSEDKDIRRSRLALGGVEEV